MRASDKTNIDLSGAVVSCISAINTLRLILQYVLMLIPIVVRFAFDVLTVRSELRMRSGWNNNHDLPLKGNYFTRGSLDEKVWSVVDQLRSLDFSERKITLSMLLETIHIDDPKEREDWVSSISNDISHLSVSKQGWKGGLYGNDIQMESPFDDDDLEVLSALKSVFSPKLVLA